MGDLNQATVKSLGAFSILEAATEINFFFLLQLLFFGLIIFSYISISLVLSI